MTNQVAITMLKNLEQSLDDYCELNDEGKEAFHMAITALELFGNSEQLPSTHSKLEKNSQKLDNENGELISRQKAKDAIDMALDHIDHVPPWVYDKLLNALNEVPSVQPRKGKWIEHDDNWANVYYECSVCKEPFVLIDGTPTENLYNFCPNCGADMREGEQDDN